MGIQEFNLEKDSEKFAVSLDRRGLIQQIKDFVISKIASKTYLDQTFDEERNQTIYEDESK